MLIATLGAVTTHSSTEKSVLPDDDEDFDYTPPAAQQEPAPQVSSLIAIIRIIAVLGMGLSVSFGLFIMLVGVKGIIVGIPIILLAIPCYYGMQFAEKLAHRAERNAAAE